MINRKAGRDVGGSCSELLQILSHRGCGKSSQGKHQSV